MGLQDRINDIVGGIGDIFSAPVGLIYDTARAITSDQYNPGFFGTFVPSTEKLITGLGRVGSGFGGDIIGNWAKDNVVGDVVRTLVNEAELLYSTEFQKQQNQVPSLLQPFGLQPGDVSAQRVGATLTGAAGSTIGAFHHGGNPLDIINLPGQWKKAANRTPGQAWVQQAIYPNWDQLSPGQKAEIEESAEYNIMSGTIDAIGRWYTDPGVIAGKGLKTVRKRYWTFRPSESNPRLIKRPKEHKQSLRQMGYGMGDEIEGPNGLRMVKLRSGKNSEVLVPVRHSVLEKLRSEGVDMADEAVDERLYQIPDEEMAQIRQIAVDNGVPEDQVDDFLDSVVRGSKADELNGEIASQGFDSGAVTDQTLTSVRYAGSTARLLHLVSPDNEVEAMRYAAALYEADPTDMPVILRVKADNLPILYEEFDNVALAGGSDFNPSDSMFSAFAGDVADNLIESRRLTPEDLDVGLGKADFDPPGRMNPRLFHPDGTPIEPDQISDFDVFSQDYERAAQLYQTSPAEAEMYMAGRRQERVMGPTPGDNLAVRAANNRVVQANLNWLDNNGKGRSMDEIRRVLFPNMAYGDVIAMYLSDAEDYFQRRTILMAAMGYKTNGIGKLSPKLQHQVNSLLRDSESIARGNRPNEMTNAMLGLDSKYVDAAAPYIPEMVEELVGELEDRAALDRFLDKIGDMSPVRELTMPTTRAAANLLRKTNFYQQSFMTRPIRAVVEKRPHQWINLKDPMSDIQLVRQLEEARSLGFKRDDIEGFRRRYSAADTEQARERIFLEANEEIIRKAAAKAKMTPEEFEEALRNSRAGTSQARDILNSRRYASDASRDTVPFVDEDTGEVVMRVMPLLSTQTSTWVPMANAAEIVRQANKIGTFRARFGQAADIPREFLDSFYRLWKPTVLLRGGWMLRVVSDEQLRILAHSGSLLTHLAAISTGDTPKFTGVFESGRPGQRLGRVLATATGTQPVTSLSVRAAKAVTAITEKLKLVDPEVLRIMRELDVEDAVSARAGFGGQSEQTLRDLQALLGRDEKLILNHLYSKGTGMWQSVEKGKEGYSSGWARVLTQQYGRDPLAKTLVEEILARRIKPSDYIDEDDMAALVAKGKRFLSDTAEGREVAERMPWRSRNPTPWIHDIVEEINGYTAGFDESLLRGILNKKVTTEMMENIDEALRPDVVHAEIVQQTLGNHPVIQYMKEFVSESFDLLGRMPTDTLSRQPFFKQLYAKEMVRLRQLRAQQGLPMNEDAILRMNKSARNYAIREVRDYLYDLAETSRFGYMVRHIAPFYPAWQEVLTVWGKLAVQDPSVIARGRLIWTAPDKLGIVETDEETGEQFMMFRLSEQTADKLGLSGWQRYLATGGLSFAKSSFNLVLNSPLPGVGPLIQYPVNEVVKNKPELEEMLRFILPNGVQTNSSAILLSPLIRQLQSELKGERGDLSMQRAFRDALTWMDVEYRSGKRTIPPTPQEAMSVARGLHTIRMFTRLMSPAQPLFNSPLKPYIDIYRDLQDNLGPETADEVFLNEYGNEFFAVTLSRTVSKTGIPPTVEAETARRDFEDLIKQYPEYGRLILGDRALGEFSTGAFAAQLERPLDPDNPFSEAERTYRETEIDPRTGGIIEVDRRLGWQEYIQALDYIDLERRKRGLPNLRVAAAQDLAEAKRNVVGYLSQKYPSWWEDFNTRNDLKWDQRIGALKNIADNGALRSRADIQGLQTYLDVRAMVLQELNRRDQLGGSSSLTSTANQDLANAWETAVFTILEDNIAFGPLFYRYLEGDPVALR